MQYPHTITLSRSYKTVSGAIYWTWILRLAWVTCPVTVTTFGHSNVGAVPLS